MITLRQQPIRAQHADLLTSDSVYCYHCSTLHKKDDTTKIGSLYFCPKCARTELKKCVICGQPVYSRRAKPYKSGYVCSTCETSLPRCTHCGRSDCTLIDVIDVYGHSTKICTSCAQRRVYKCPSCGKAILVNEDALDKSIYLGMCPRCQRKTGVNQVEETGYHSGANNPTKWYGAAAEAKNPRGCGFELEIERVEAANSSNRQKAQLIKELRLEYGDLIRSIEHDGSLTDGLEIVSQPITYTAYSRTNWDNFFAIIKKHGYSATRNTGLHLHIDRYVLGRDKDNNRERKQSLAKLAYLTVKEYGLFRRLSGREDWDSFADENDSVYWARNLTSARTGFNWDTRKPLKDEAIRWAEESHGHYTSYQAWRGLPSHDYRYRILNTDNEHTIEWRIGSSTVDPDAFIAWIDFLGTITRNALRISWDNVDRLDKWLEGISPETLAFYNNKCGLSLSAECGLSLSAE